MVLRKKEMVILKNIQEGGEEGYANTPIPAIFFTKSVDTPIVFFKSETTIILHPEM